MMRSHLVLAVLVAASLTIAAVLTISAGLTIAAGQSAADRARGIDVARSTMTVYVFKEGIFAFAADNHEVNVPIAWGSYDDSKRTVELTINAAKMRVLDTKMPDARRAKVQANMVGPQVLDATRFPNIAFHSTAIDAASGGGWTVTGDLTLHGQTHPISLHVTNTDATHFNGAAVVRQTAFGITPIRIAGGTVRVKDDVKIVFDIALK